MTSFTCVMIQSSFSTIFPFVKAKEQMPGSCSLRGHDRLKENVQLGTAALLGTPSSEKSEEGDLKVQKGHVGLPLLLAKPSQQCCHTSWYSLLPGAWEQRGPEMPWPMWSRWVEMIRPYSQWRASNCAMLREILRFRQCITVAGEMAPWVKGLPATQVWEPECGVQHAKSQCPQKQKHGNMVDPRALDWPALPTSCRFKLLKLTRK